MNCAQAYIEDCPMLKASNRDRDLEHSIALVPLHLIQDDESQRLWWIDFLLREINRLVDVLAGLLRLSEPDDE